MPKKYTVLLPYLTIEGAEYTTSVRCMDERDAQLLHEAAHALNHHEALRTALSDAAAALVELGGMPHTLRAIDKALLESKI